MSLSPVNGQPTIPTIFHTPLDGKEFAVASNEAQRQAFFPKNQLKVQTSIVNQLDKTGMASPPSKTTPLLARLPFIQPPVGLPALPPNPQELYHSAKELIEKFKSADKDYTLPDKVVIFAFEESNKDTLEFFKYVGKTVAERRHASFKTIKPDENHSWQNYEDFLKTLRELKIKNHGKPLSELTIMCHGAGEEVSAVNMGTIYIGASDRSAEDVVIDVMNEKLIKPGGTIRFLNCAVAGSDYALTRLKLQAHWKNVNIVAYKNNITVYPVAGLRAILLIDFEELTGEKILIKPSGEVEHRIDGLEGI